MVPTRVSDISTTSILSSRPPRAGNNQKASVDQADGLCAVDSTAYRAVTEMTRALNIMARIFIGVHKGLSATIRHCG